MRLAIVLFGLTGLLDVGGPDRGGPEASPRAASRPFTGRVPPEIVSMARNWVNADGTTTLADLRGRVVWLQFNFWENCTPLRLHLVRWDRQFGQDGLVIVEIDDGRNQALSEVRRSVERKGVKHRVLWDEGGRNHRRYGVSTWPSAALIGRDGRVIWQGRPSKACGGGDGRQRVVDKATGTVLERLIIQALKAPPPGGGVTPREKETGR